MFRRIGVGERQRRSGEIAAGTVPQRFRFCLRKRNQSILRQPFISRYRSDPASALPDQTSAGSPPFPSCSRVSKYRAAMTSTRERKGRSGGAPAVQKTGVASRVVPVLSPEQFATIYDSLRENNLP